MFLRVSLDLARVSLRANPQLETPFLCPENHRNVSRLSLTMAATRAQQRCSMLGCKTPWGVYFASYQLRQIFAATSSILALSAGIIRIPAQCMSCREINCNELLP